MVMGHIFSFDIQEDADKLVKFLKKEDISARIEPVSNLSMGVGIKGKYQNLISYLDYKKNELQQSFEEILSEDTETEEIEEAEVIQKGASEEIYPCQKMEEQNENADEGDSDDSDEEIFSEEDYLQLIEEIDDTITDLGEDYNITANILQEKSAGEILLTDDVLKDEEEQIFFQKVMFFIDNYSVLFQNGLIEFKDNSFTLVKVLPAEDLIFSINLSPDIMPIKEEREKYDLTIEKKIRAKIHYMVKTGPEFLLKMDMEKLVTELENLEREEEDISEDLHFIQLKQQAVDHIFSLLNNTGVDTVEKLLESALEPEEEYDEEMRISTTYDLTSSFIINTIEDLKKLEIIRMKGNRIKKIR